LLAVVPGQHLVELTRHGGRDIVHVKRLVHLVDARLLVRVRLLYDRLDSVVAAMPEPVPGQSARPAVRGRVVRTHGRYELPTGVFKALMITTTIITIIIVIVIVIITINIITIVIIVIVINIIIFFIIFIIIIIIVIVIGTLGARDGRGTPRRARALAYLSGARRLPERHAHQFAGRGAGHRVVRGRRRQRRRWWL